MFLAIKRIFVVILLATCVAPIAWCIDAAPAFDDPILQQRYVTLTQELRCLVCQNETIADSQATLAADLRKELREQIASGKSDEQILKFLTDRYGAFVLYKPPFDSRTWILWASPAILLLGGLFIAVRIIVRRAKLAAEHPEQLNEDEIEGGKA
jgi:cytochrome c-type biogenesis protein CcmH